MRSTSDVNSHTLKHFLRAQRKKLIISQRHHLQHISYKLYGFVQPSVQLLVGSHWYVLACTSQATAHVLLKAIICIK